MTTIESVCRSFVALTSLSLHSAVMADLTINEFVTDPQQDRNGDGIITGSDEFFEFHNNGIEPITMSNYFFRMIDTTPIEMYLPDLLIGPEERYCILNPEGMQNNNGRLELLDISAGWPGILVDSVSYGSWQGNIDGIPSGNAAGLYNESLSRFPEDASFIQTYATFGQPNVPSCSGLLTLGLCAGLHFSARRRFK